LQHQFTNDLPILRKEPIRFHILLSVWLYGRFFIFPKAIIELLSMTIYSIL